MIVRTDHRALTSLKTNKLVSSRFTWWIMAIQDYHFEIEHCQGKLNVVAVTLSRISSYEGNYPFDLNQGKIFLYTLAKRLSSELHHRLQNFVQEQKKLSNLAKAIQRHQGRKKQKQNLDLQRSNIFNNKKREETLPYRRNNLQHNR